MEGGYEYYEFDLCKEFPPDLNNCTGWFDGNIPDYKVKFCNGPPPSGSSTTAAISTSAKKESIAPVPQQVRKSHNELVNFGKKTSWSQKDTFHNFFFFLNIFNKNYLQNISIYIIPSFF